MATTLSTDAQIRLRTGLATICRQAGLDPADATLIKYTMNAVYRLDRAGVVVRMATGPSAAQRVDRVVQAAAAFASLDLPTVRLAMGLDQPIHAGGWSASIWQLLPQPARYTWAPVDLAEPLRAIHAVTDLAVDLPRWDPVMKSRRRLAELADLDPGHYRAMHDWALHQVGVPLEQIIDQLTSWCDQLDLTLREVEWRLPPGVIHGDAHTGNILATRDGRAALGDLDSVAFGPREWDLTPAAHGVQRFGRSSADYAAFASMYGADITTLPGWEPLRQARELQLVTSVIGSLHGRPGVADQLAYRLRTIMTGDLTSRWNRYT